MNEVNINNNELFEKFEIIQLYKPIDLSEIHLFLRDVQRNLFWGMTFQIIFYGDYFDDNQLFYFPCANERFCVRNFSDLESIDFYLKNK